jgi:hypothetical protein
MTLSADTGFFGHPNAYFDRQTFSSFYPIPAFQVLKSGQKGSKYFLTGVFGCGKTAILSQIRDSAPKNALVWELNEHKPPTNQIDYTRLAKTTGALANVTVNLLLWELANIILRYKDRFPKDGIATLKKLFPSLAERFGKGLLRAASVSDPLGILELDFGKVFEDKGAAVSQVLPLEEWKEALAPSLSQVPAYILLDDVEIIFPGTQDIAGAADGLLYAVEILNGLLGAQLTCLTTLQYSTFLMLERGSKRFEKLMPRAEKILWTAQDLQALLAARVMEKMKLKISTTEALTQVFDAKDEKDLGELLQFAISFCINGPRDLIGLCNSAYAIAESKRVGRSHFERVLPDFGNLKLGSIEREFNDRYKEIRSFIEHFFSRQNSMWEPSALETTMNGWLPEARDIFGKQSWLVSASRQVIGILYEIGFLGFKATSSAPAVYALSDPFAHRRPTFYASFQYVVHPAFRQILGMDTASSSSTRKSKQK